MDPGQTSKLEGKCKLAGVLEIVQYAFSVCKLDHDGGFVFLCFPALIPELVNFGLSHSPFGLPDSVSNRQLELRIPNLLDLPLAHFCHCLPHLSH